MGAVQVRDDNPVEVDHPVERVAVIESPGATTAPASGSGGATSIPSIQYQAPLSSGKGRRRGRGVAGPGDVVGVVEAAGDRRGVWSRLPAIGAVPVDAGA